jgi:hypothetical protein
MIITVLNIVIIGIQVYLMPPSPVQVVCRNKQEDDCQCWAGKEQKEVEVAYFKLLSWFTHE